MEEKKVQKNQDHSYEGIYTCKGSSKILKTNPNISSLQDRLFQKTLKSRDHTPDTQETQPNQRSRTVKPTDNLYKDALRRIEQKKIVQKPEIKHFLSESSSHLLSSKVQLQLRQEYNRVMEHEEQNSTQFDQKLNFKQLKTLMGNMCFFDVDQDEKQSIEIVLIKKIWEELNHESTGIHFNNLLNFVLCILGFHPNNTKQIGKDQSQNISQKQQSEQNAISSQDQSKLAQSFESKQYGFFQGEEYIITESSQHKIQKDFKLLHDFQKEIINQVKQSSQKIQTEEPSFHPDIQKSQTSNKTNKQNQQYKSKNKLTSNQATQMAQRLFDKKMQYNQKKAQAYQEKEKQNFEQCTFHPTINTRNSKARSPQKKETSSRSNECFNFMDSKLAKEKAKELYQKGLEQKRKLQELVKKNEQEILKNPELTFQPKIIKNQNHKVQPSQGQSQNVKGVDRILERMKRGRDQKELTKQLQAKGFPYMGTQSAKFLDKCQEESNLKSKLDASNNDLNNENNNRSYIRSQIQQQQDRAQRYNEQKEIQSQNKQKGRVQGANQNKKNAAQQGKNPFNVQSENQEEDQRNDKGQNRNERITLFEGDDAQEVAKDFIKQHNLNISLLPKLERIILEQIENIQEEEVEEVEEDEEENADQQEFNGNEQDQNEEEL